MPIAPLTPSELQRSQARVAPSYAPDLIGRVGTQLADVLAEHFRELQTREPRVLNWSEPPDSIAAARDLLAADNSKNQTAAETSQLLERIKQLMQTMLARGQNLHHPRYLGHQVPASVPVAGWFDAVGAVTNQVMAIYEMGPWATAVEQALVEQLGERIGWQPQQFAGLITHGGSLANLTGLLTARNVALPDGWQAGLASSSAQSNAPVIVVNADAHYSVIRAAGVLGLGTHNVLPAALDRERRIDPQQLDQQLDALREAGRVVVAVVACACATPIGAFDRLPAIADVCQRHQVWLHVDAAHGGAALMSDRYRLLLEGLDRADSVVIDAHKMFFMPALCAFVFYRNREHRYEAFRQDAPYLFDPSHPGMAEYDSGMKTLECTKRAAAFGLWGTWSTFGEQLFGDLVDVTFALCAQLYELLDQADDFEPLHQPECNILVFRHIPPQLKDAGLEQLGAFQMRLRRKLIESGDFYIVQSRMEGHGALRVTIINPLTTIDDLHQLLERLRTHAQDIL